MKFFAALAALTLCPVSAHAAEIDGSQLSAWWGIPFAGTLLSIAILPLALPQLWHHHFGKIAAAWALALAIPFAVVFGPAAMAS
ncbi:MAG: sodium:proton antiporter, partial [Pseudorhodobacter sp.]|nr:sodium:proton antiporter [Rhizobacter sp.]